MSDGLIPYIVFFWWISLLGAFFLGALWGAKQRDD